MIFRNSIIILSLIFVFNPGQVKAFCEESGCDQTHFIEQLVMKESTGNQLANTTIKSGGRTAQTAMGWGQILHTEAVDWGCIPGRQPGSLSTKESLTQAEIDSYLNDADRQMACITVGLEKKHESLERNGYGNGGGGYDCGSLLATSWLGDPYKVAKGEGCTGDANNSKYTTCTRAQEFQGVCAGGELMEANFEYAGRAAFADSILLGCDPNILETNKAIVNQTIQISINTINETVTQPTDAAIATCGEKRLQAYADVSKEFSQPDGGSTTFFADLQNSFTNLVSGNMTGIIPGTVSEIASVAYSNSVSSSDGCTVHSDIWDAVGCNPFSGVPSLGDIVGRQIGKITGAIEDLANLPSRLSEAICSASNDLVKDLVGDFENSANDLTDAFTRPIEDGIEFIDDNINDFEDSIY